MADAVIQQIKDKLDIVEVISGYLKLEKTGINLRAPCPFHSEKKPSFFVSPARQSYKCFGCNVGGDVFEFVKQIEGIEFGDALRLLAKRAGVELPTFRPELQSKRQRLYEICEIATRFYQKQLEGSAKGKSAKEYLLDRGLKGQTIQTWRLGYSPDTWRALSDFLVGRGYNRQEIVEAGLAVKSDKSPTPYDRFRGRIIFPIFDLHSQVVGFGGRVFGQDESVAKYLNTPATLLYDKSRVLYGLNLAKLPIRAKNYCILTEGYTDVILSHQAGFTNTVASSGTALTQPQLSILKRYSQRLLTAFDMDSAGSMATKRGIDLAQAADFEVKVITMEAEKDPADIISQNPAKWQEAVDNSKEIMAFYFDSAISKFDKEQPQGKKQIAKALLPAIKKVPNHILQSHWINKLANLLRVSEEAISQELKRVIEKPVPVFPKSAQPSQTIQKSTKPSTRQELLEAKVLSLVLANPKTLDLVGQDCLDNSCLPLKTIFGHFKKANLDNKEEIQQLASKIAKKEPEAAQLLEICLFEADTQEEQDVPKEVTLCLSELKEITTRSKLEEISKEITEAEQKGEDKKIKVLMEQFKIISQNFQTS